MLGYAWRIIRYIKRPFLYIWFVVSYKIFNMQKRIPDIHFLQHKKHSNVDYYWNWHTVSARPFLTAKESERNLEWRFNEYPLFRELSGLYGDHSGQVILDYGCGPGNDLIGFGIRSGARKIIGIDISEKALCFAQHRLALHRIDPDRIELFCISDSSTPTIPIPDNSIDFFSSQGVIHHTSHPDQVLKELYRVLKQDGKGCIMVYNYDSIWLHLYTAYQRIILNGKFKGLNIYDAFTKNTDGESCPIAHCYKPDEFINMCQSAGFRETHYMGGYLSKMELDILHTYYEASLKDGRLPAIHAQFLKDLTWDKNGYPMYNGKYAGVGGVYTLKK
ncbi:MAG: class I SAM-dependent methyltransferase [Syntrophomonadaceae bacterium]|nr:class I SAM-dependent methyltransferase [Syntrophomonadaceae bacterium]